ncbi:GNAT family N-acetyltransferase [Roseibium sp. FZY0029]|uniref:GNAT family N-acetyltransferase n=1 Tax=Roseibium sp. FZY0029 TaxID=3116647 RepID=UPI002EA7B75D|nr:GNAT family N-acetyltransferase [Roseibium sp. FZY0029]
MALRETEHLLALESRAVSRIRVREIKAPSLSEMNSLWASLKGGAVSTPFQTPEFLAAFQESGQQTGASGFSVGVFTEPGESEHPLMLLPLARYQRGPIRVVGMPDFGLADQNAPVIAAGCRLSGDCRAEMIQAFLQRIADADVVDIQKLHDRVDTLENPLSFLPETISHSSSLVLDLRSANATGNWCGKSVYKKTRSKFRKLVSEGVTLVEAVTPEERVDLFRTLAAQRRERFRQLGRVDSLGREDRSAFYLRLAAMEASPTPFKTLALKQGEETVAAMVLMMTGAQATAVLVSIGHPKWHAFSPGMVLFSKAIERAYEAGVRWFSFGTGQQEYKQRFGGDEHPSRRLLMPLSTRGRLFVGAREAHRAAQNVLQIALRRNGVDS